MKYGVVLPQVEGLRDPVSTRDFAQAVEGLRFNHLVGFDHVVGAEPTNRPEGWRTHANHKMFIHEPLVLFSHLGAVTKTLEFFSAIIILPQRQTALFAKQAAAVDYLIGGRLRFGIAVGWNPIEFEALNENFGNRGRRFEEQIEVLRALWTQEVVDYKGRYHTIDRAGVNPLPAQRPIPLWFGGYADSVLRRTAALADGWIPNFKPGEETSKEMVATLRGYIRDAGRQESDVGIEGRLNLTVGSPEDWAAELEEWQELGATHLSLNTGQSPDWNDHTNLLSQFKALA